MPKFSTKAGVSVEAHLVSETEAPLQAKTAGGVEQLDAGDALVTVKGKAYRVPAPLFEALLAPEHDRKADAGDEKPSKGGQQESRTQGARAEK